MNRSRNLNFGCGKVILPDHLNVDGQQAEGIDLSFDFDQKPYPFADDSFDTVFSDNVFEHLKDPAQVMDELWRICAAGAVIHILVPYWNAYNAYNDLTHRHFFNERAIENMCGINSSYQHEGKDRFAIKSLRLKPSRPFSFFPAKVRKRLSMYLCTVIEEIDVEIQVLKD